MSPLHPTRSLARALSLAFLGPAAALALAGCHTIHRELKANDCNKPQPYELARTVPPLKVPTDVDPPDTRGALKIPPLNEPAPPPRKPTDPCLDEPPPFAATGRPSEQPPAATPSQPAKPASRRRHRGRRASGGGDGTSGG